MDKGGTASVWLEGTNRSDAWRLDRVFLVTLAAINLWVR